MYSDVSDGSIIHVKTHKQAAVPIVSTVTGVGGKAQFVADGRGDLYIVPHYSATSAQFGNKVIIKQTDPKKTLSIPLTCGKTTPCALADLGSEHLLVWTMDMTDSGVNAAIGIYMVEKNASSTASPRQVL